MPKHKRRTTWDGKPVSDEPPYGATIVLFRRNQGQIEYLILHRSFNGAEYEGEWAWTPPSGARYPGEPIETCGRRELKEEVGMDMIIQRLSGSRLDWVIYFAELVPDEKIELCEEHDRFEWVSLREALKRCQPDIVGAAFRKVDLALREDKNSSGVGK